MAQSSTKKEGLETDDIKQETKDAHSQAEVKELETKETENKETQDDNDPVAKFKLFSERNNKYQHYLCGMNPSLSFHIRSLNYVLKNNEDHDTYLNELKKIFNGMKASMNIMNDDNISFGISCGYTMNPLYFLCDFNEDIVMYLLMDPLWIDCKQRTWTKKSTFNKSSDTRKKEKLFLNSTYKWDIDCQLNHSKNNCKYCQLFIKSLSNDEKKLSQFGYNIKIKNAGNNKIVEKQDLAVINE